MHSSFQITISKTFGVVAEGSAAAGSAAVGSPRRLEFSWDDRANRRGQSGGQQFAAFFKTLNREDARRGKRFTRFMSP